MDVLLKLRVLIWLLVLSLWGMLVYQYLGEEEAERKMLYVANPYKGVTAPQAPATAATPEVPPSPPRQDDSLVSAPGSLLPGAIGGPEAMRPLPPGGGPLPSVIPDPDVKGVAPRRDPTQQEPELEPQPQPRPSPTRPAPSKRPARRDERLVSEPKTPPGFLKRVTRHFTVWAEGTPPTDEFLGMLEALHGNLMLDLAAFSPWARDQRVSIFLFKSQDTYRQITGRPAWSGGASNVSKRAVYLYESEELPGILAHELCHIYYDGFFLEGKTNPLWLSEGMATLVQVERGLAAPTWLRENLQLLEDGRGFPIEQLVALGSTRNYPDSQVRLWYAQSYSIVRFLIRSQQSASFYNFSRHLRDGRPVTESLYRGYGMPFNRLKALELAWRYDLTTNRISQLNPSKQ